ncbi:MAG: hypothetical protein WC089_03805 [Candidatus Paceibacterota bacterium]
MVQYIKQGDIFGRIGENLGKGLAEQLPKAVERGRLSAALKDIGERKDQTPFQQFTGLASQASEYPQIVQSGSELLRQQGMLNAAQNKPKGSEFNEIESRRNSTPSPQGTGLVGQKNTQAALQPAIPKTFGELQDRAAELNKESPSLYPDYKTAIAAAQAEDQAKINVNAAEQNARQTQKGVESDIRNEIADLKNKANVRIPDNTYQKVENKALDRIKNGENELKVAKDARDELDAISRDYSKIDSFGNYTLLGSNPKDVIRTIDSLKAKFSKNDDSENLADSLVARVGLSNEYGHFLAHDIPQDIQTFIKKTPIDSSPEFMAKNIGPMLNKNDSPLAIAHLLSENNEMNTAPFKKYLLDNKREFNLSDKQVRELEKVDSIGQGYMNDLWLKAFGGK